MVSHLQSAMGLHLDLTCVKLSNTQVELKNAQETIRKLEEKFHTRKMIWKINGFSKIKGEAKNGKNTKIESDPFYTESPGYKLKVRIYPNGHGNGKNTHLSVLIVVMKGEYDAILPWPFNKEVTVTLIDQEEDLLKRENLVVKLTPDIDSLKYFSRPEGEENLGRGWPRFISHLKLQARSYVVDDTLFLQVEIDPLWPASLSTAVLPVNRVMDRQRVTHVMFHTDTVAFLSSDCCFRLDLFDWANWDQERMK